MCDTVRHGPSSSVIGESQWSHIRNPTIITHMHTDRKLPRSSLLLPSTPFPDVFTDSTNAPWGSALCQALGIP